jgi:hypothetical protein
MAQNFLGCDREQELLLPPSMRDWLAEDHFGWFVLDAVERLDLEAFYASYGFVKGGSSLLDEGAPRRPASPRGRCRAASC